ncbi:MAG TPA: zinc ribbon domain-containing protein [Anaerolineae bacterium]|nr:zinc ribbon domain-containing protein [Anaerolineae bacterium]HQI84660.1 zinc ribbon domain-containing protein [Anaerolineae bacterium]
MNEHLLQKVACPNCNAPIDLRGQSTAGAYVHCAACGSEFVLKGHVCPYCGAYHEQEAGFCRKCGAGLTRRCPKCSTINWIGDEYCVNCGAPLDILELIVQRHTQGTAGRLYQQMDEAQTIKEMEMAASQARMNRMLAEEREHQAAIRRRLLEQRRREKKVLTIVLGVAAVLVIIIIVVALLA